MDHIMDQQCITHLWPLPLVGHDFQGATVNQQMSNFLIQGCQQMKEFGHYISNFENPVDVLCSSNKLESLLTKYSSPWI